MRERGAAAAGLVPAVAHPTPATAASGFDVRAVRAQFPIFRAPRERPLVYLDSAATSQKPDAVLEAMHRYYTTINANIHRGIYRIAEQATAAYEDARRRVAGLIHAPSVREVIFTRNSTEAINLVAYAWGRAHLAADDAILLTEMEHHANLVPWQILARERDVELRFIPVTGSGELDLAALPALLADGRVKLTGVVHISNVLGTVNPVEAIAREAHAAGSLVLVDASQSVPHRAVDVQALGADFVAFTGHKMLGPTGIGVLWGRRALLEAVDYLEALGLDAVFAHDQALASVALQRLAEVPGLRPLGPAPDRRGGIVAFVLDGVHAHDVAAVLDADGVAVRAGHHCAMPLHEALGIHASVRASFHCYSLEEDLDALVRGLARVRETFGA
jgi:cysteine desulfurase/selenocysteine lyase